MLAFQRGCQRMCRDGRRQQGGGGLGGREARGHWALMAGAMACVWAAALAKEIGITTVGTAVLLDLYLVPFTAQQPPPGADRGCARMPVSHPPYRTPPPQRSPPGRQHPALAALSCGPPV